MSRGGGTCPTVMVQAAESGRDWEEPIKAQETFHMQTDTTQIQWLEKDWGESRSKRIRIKKNNGRN